MSVASPGEPMVLPAPARLHRGSDIRSVLRSRQRAAGRYVVAHFRDRVEEGEAPPGRVAVVAGKRVGSAVRRNRAKRRLRAAARESGVTPGRDVVLVARHGADEAPWEALRREVARGCRRRSDG